MIHLFPGRLARLGPQQVREPPPARPGRAPAAPRRRPKGGACAGLHLRPLRPQRGLYGGLRAVLPHRLDALGLCEPRGAPEAAQGVSEKGSELEIY